MSQLENTCRLEYHKEIVELEHRQKCTQCYLAFTAMSIIVDLSMEEKNLDV